MQRGPGLKLAVVLFLIACGSLARGQGVSAREMFFAGTTPAPPARQAPPASKPGPPVRSARQSAVAPAARPSTTAVVMPDSQPAAPLQAEPPLAPPPARSSTASSTASSNAATAGIPLVQAALHLGLRYNVLLVDPQSGKSREIDPDANLQDGDCVAVRFTPNRAGYLYVFNSGTTGAWQPLLPSPEMPDESVTVDAGVATLFPRNYCLQISPPRGSERLLIVLTGIAEDFENLGQAIRKSVQSPPGGPPSTAPAPPPPSSKDNNLLALNLLGKEIERMQAAQISSRDLVIQKLTPAETGDEPPNSVYVVKAAASSADRLILEIFLRHE